MITESYGQQIFDNVQARLRGRLPRDEHTVPWVVLACRSLRAEGHPAVMRAGSAFWSTGANWFGYRWSPQNPWNSVWQTLGLPPEFHAWVEIQATDPVLLDLTTGAWPARALQQGITWKADKPPEFFCAPVLTARNYTANRDATVAAVKLAKRLSKLYPKLLGQAVDEQIACLLKGPADAFSKR